MAKSVPTQKKVVIASVRVLNRSLISIVLTQAKTAQIFLDLGLDVLDGARREHEIRAATKVIDLIDDILITLEANREQRAEIKKARNDLADRVKKSQSELASTMNVQTF